MLSTVQKKLWELEAQNKSRPLGAVERLWPLETLIVSRLSYRTPTS